jgi:hypothetical protein
MSITDILAKENHQATRVAGILDAEMTERSRALDQGLHGGPRTDYSQMISGVAKERERIELERPGMTRLRVRDSN